VIRYSRRDLTIKPWGVDQFPKMNRLNTKPGFPRAMTHSGEGTHMETDDKPQIHVIPEIKLGKSAIRWFSHEHFRWSLVLGFSSHVSSPEGTGPRWSRWSPKNLQEDTRDGRDYILRVMALWDPKRANPKKVPSGKLTQLWKITIFNGKNHYKWPFSITMLN
jgi:hypothetical protein